MYSRLHKSDDYTGNQYWQGVNIIMITTYALKEKYRVVIIGYYELSHAQAVSVLIQLILRILRDMPNEV